jgi:hypothetical protein
MDIHSQLQVTFERIMASPKLTGLAFEEKKKAEELIRERLNDRIIKTLLAMMTSEQLARYQQTLHTNDAVALEQVTAEMAAEIPGFEPALTIALEEEMKQIEQLLG